jgi:RNA polymerase-binding transcription factor DksA
MPVHVDELRTQLMAQKQHLEAAITDQTTASGASIGYGNHMAEDANYAYEQTKSLALQQNLKELLLQVNEALQRLDDGVYGVCVNCGKSVDPARLQAIPDTSLCLRCARP